MKRIIALLLVCLLVFSGCTPQNTGVEEVSSLSSEEQVLVQNTDIIFTDLSDPDLLTYVEDTVYSDLAYKLNSESYFIENVSALYISNEYLEELSYNSKENIYFGFTLSELEEQFDGTKFIFTLGDDGQTTVREFEDYDEIYDQVIKNVALGFGVILLCVTVSIVAGPAGAPAVSMIFAASAKSGTIFALSSSVFSGCAAGVVTGIETKDFNQAVKSSALAGSEGFKWGAITGVIFGGATSAIALKGGTLNGLTMNQAATIQKESKYPIEMIKDFKTMEEYELFKEAGLKANMINGKTALIREIDLNYIDKADKLGRTNLTRMQEGLPALDPATGAAYQLHHINQKINSPLAILTKSEHMLDGNNRILHEIGKASEIVRPAFIKQKKDFWESFAKKLTSGGI